MRLEDIDPKTAEGFPVLKSDGVGNMEPKEWNIPPGPGEGGVEKVVLDDSLKSKVTAAISEYGFNMVAAGTDILAHKKMMKFEFQILKILLRNCFIGQISC